MEENDMLSPEVYDIFGIQTTIWAYPGDSLDSIFGDFNIDNIKILKFKKSLEDSGFRIAKYCLDKSEIKIVIDGEYKFDDLIDTIRKKDNDDPDSSNVHIYVTDHKSEYTILYNPILGIHRRPSDKFRTYNMFGGGAMPFIKNVSASTIGLDLVAVQPMSAPVGQLFYIGYKCNSSSTPPQPKP